MFDFSHGCEYNISSLFFWKHFVSIIFKEGGRPMATVFYVFAGVRGMLPHDFIGKVRPLAFRP